MKKQVFFILVATIVLLSSCGIKQIPDDKMEYIGTWASDKVTLTITENGRVEYHKNTSAVSSKSISGPIQKFDGNNFIVGALGINTTFVVSEQPHMEAGVTKMTVDGEELVKQ